MKRPSPLTLPLALASTDLIATSFAFLAAYWLRYHTGLSTPRGVAAFSDTLAAFGYVAVIWLLVFHACGLYQARHVTSTLDEFYSVAIAVTLSCVAFLAAAFLAQAFTYSRGVLAFAWALDIVLVTAARTLLRAIRKQRWRRGLGLRRVWFVGPPGPAVAALFGHPDYGVVTAGTSSLDQVRWDEADALVIAASLPLDELRAVLDECERRGVEARFLPTAADLLLRNGTLETVAGVPIVSFAAGPALLWRLVGKRILDVVVSATLLILFALPLLLIALLIRLTSPGPALFRQERVGRNGRLFRMLKFRTIAIAQQHEAVQSGGDHPGLTPIGRWLRRFSLDELPQFINVLRGDMSLVGPRPEQLTFVEQNSALIPGYRFRHRVKTGLTGWAQVHDLRSSTSMEARTRYDLHYVENWSLLLDLKIIVKTAFEFLFHRNAR